MLVDIIPNNAINPPDGLNLPSEKLASALVKHYAIMQKLVQEAHESTLDIKDAAGEAVGLITTRIQDNHQMVTDDLVDILFGPLNRIDAKASELIRDLEREAKILAMMYRLE